MEYYYDFAATVSLSYREAEKKVRQYKKAASILVEGSTKKSVKRSRWRIEWFKVIFV